MGSRISWLLPAALVLLAVVLVATWRQPRTSRTRASMVLWGGWLLVTGLVFSLAQGIIHPYYTVALAPAIGAIIGIGSWFLWSRRGALWARLAMGSVVVGTAVWGAVLLDRVPAWHPWLRTAILVTGCVAGALLVVSPYYERVLSARAARPCGRPGRVGRYSRPGRAVCLHAGHGGHPSLGCHPVSGTGIGRSGRVPRPAEASAGGRLRVGPGVGLAQPEGRPAQEAQEEQEAASRRAAPAASGCSRAVRPLTRVRRARVRRARVRRARVRRARVRRERQAGRAGPVPPPEAGFLLARLTAWAGPAVASAACSTRAHPARPLRPPSRRTRPGSPGWRLRSVPTRLPVTSWRPESPLWP